MAIFYLPIKDYDDNDELVWIMRFFHDTDGEFLERLKSLCIKYNGIFKPGKEGIKDFIFQSEGDSKNFLEKI